MTEGQLPLPTIFGKVKGVEILRFTQNDRQEPCSVILKEQATEESHTFLKRISSLNYCGLILKSQLVKL